MTNLNSTDNIPYCIYCWPTKRTSHFNTKLDYYNEKFAGFIFRPAGKLLLHFNARGRDIIWGKFLELLSVFGIVKFESHPDESKMHDRNLMFFQEAKKRGLRIEVAWIPKRKDYSNDFRFWYKGKKYYYDSIPLAMYGSTIDIDNKIKIKQLLAKNNIPVVEGRLFFSERRALKYARKLGFPLVVKPNSASLSMHLSVNIQNELALKEAIKIAKQYEPVFIVERFLAGDLYRATVIAQNTVLVCQRDAAHVIGDGTSSIRQLIEKRNMVENRDGHLRGDGTMAFEISVDLITKQGLLADNLNLDGIPQAGEKVYITKKFAPQTGNDITIVTENVHPKNIDLFLKIARLISADIVGIDVIIQDISKPYDEQACAIIETNSIPYTNVHQYPSSGKSEPVAAMVWDVVLGRLGK